MLNIPANFENDIQGRDTALYPIVRIGGDDPTWISTNSTSFGNAQGVLPLLSNIPSIKESIDIEKRNYKISSVNLDISNFPYEGKRFSELFGDLSLINTEVRIFWVSPSVEDINLIDIAISEEIEIGDHWALQIYNGTIRRYTHDDEKVRLVVEDRSQATLHKDLPLEKHYLTEDNGHLNVPDKYKNKPIPMVYGHVDRSPCVISQTPLIEEWGITEGRVIIQSDADVASNMNNLYIYDNTYIVLPPTLDLQNNQSNIFDYPNGMEQFTLTNNIATLASSSSMDGEDVNPISLNKIIAYQEINKEGMTFKPLQEKSAFWSSTSGWNPNGGGSRSWYGSYLKVVGGVPSFYGSLFKEADGDDNDWQGSYYLWEDANYPHDNPPEEQFYYDIWNESGGQDDKHEMKLVGGVVKTGAFDIGASEESAGILYWEGEIWMGNASASATGWGGETGGEGIYVRIGGGTHDDYLLGIHNITINDHLESVFIQAGGTLGAWSVIDNTDQLLIYLRPSEAFRTAVELKLTELTLYNYALIKNMLDQDFYANVTGRGDLFCTSIDAIENILEQELGVSVPYQHPGTYWDWRYAFTVDKKINSKKLIEGIASASPFIPRFNNMGEFKFDTIPDDGGSVTTNSDGSASENHTITEAEVIDFSFSRTKIEDVCTKVIFKYNWDYARGEFNDSVTADIEDILEGYDFDYYGFQGTTDDPDAESTVTIDDDRGKYIREGYTAQDFADWYLLWNANQHLKMKVKLPLKYMNLEIGDFVDFDAILGEVNPYGINYIEDGEVNGQEVFKTFLITSTNKTLEWVEIECVQMHNLNVSGGLYAGTQGCNDPESCNYDADADDASVCKYNDCTYDPSDDSTWEGACGGNAKIDCCGVCNGNAICDGCGDCGEEGELDECGVCNGDNSSCADCNGVPNGLKITNNCGDCVIEGDATDILCIEGCDGIWKNDGTHLMYDECDPPVCGGDNSTCTQCPDDGIVTLWGIDYPIDTEEISIDGSGYEIDDPEAPFVNMIGQVIPAEIGCFTNLKTLEISSCELEGLIPITIGDLTSLETLRLNGMYLNGAIPSSIGNLENLTVLNLQSNQLDYLPSEITNLQSLNTLDLSSNNLSNEIPENIGNLSGMGGSFDLSHNQLSGLIPESICYLPMPFGSPLFNIDYNSLCPTYPSCVENHVGYQYIDDCDEEEVYVAGDVNGDGDWNILDLVQLVNCILTIADGGTCPPSGDMNGSGDFNILDIVQLSNCVLEGSCGG